VSADKLNLYEETYLAISSFIKPSEISIDNNRGYFAMLAIIISWQANAIYNSELR